MTSASRQPVQSPARPVQNRRSVVWSFGRASVRFIDGELLAQGKVLEGEQVVAADEEGDEPEQVEYESDHESRLWPDRARGSTSWLADDVWAKDTRFSDTFECSLDTLQRAWLACSCG